MKARERDAWLKERAARSAAVRGGIAPLVKPLHSVVMGGGTCGPVPKTAPYRDAVLLEMARGRPCLMMVPGVCNHRLDTTVAAHSNLSIHGKSKGRKAEDCYTVAACHACHSWLDQGPAPARQKEAAFMAGHALQVMAWRNIAAASDEPERFRKAARRALERLNATPIGEQS